LVLLVTQEQRIESCIRMMLCETEYRNNRYRSTWPACEKRYLCPKLL